MDRKGTITVVEDDAAIRRVLELALRSAGYEVRSEGTGDGGFASLVAEVPDLALLDIMLPGMSGLEICRRLRVSSETADLPIILLTAKGEDRDIVAGLDAGANDYVTKPFSKEVLLARIRAALRRPGGESSPVVELDGLVIDDAAHMVSIAGRALELTLSEYRILLLLVSNRHRVFTRSLIIDRISDEEKIVTDRTVDVQMVGLRKKLGDWADHIETIRGVGYRMR